MWNIVGMPSEPDSPTSSSEDGRPPQCPGPSAHGLDRVNTQMHTTQQNRQVMVSFCSLLANVRIVLRQRLIIYNQFNNTNGSEMHSASLSYCSSKRCICRVIKRKYKNFQSAVRECLLSDDRRESSQTFTLTC